MVNWAGSGHWYNIFVGADNGIYYLNTSNGFGIIINLVNNVEIRMNKKSGVMFLLKSSFS